MRTAVESTVYSEVCTALDPILTSLGLTGSFGWRWANDHVIVEANSHCVKFSIRSNENKVTVSIKPTFGSREAFRQANFTVERSALKQADITALAAKVKAKIEALLPICEAAKTQRQDDIKASDAAEKQAAKIIKQAGLRRVDYGQIALVADSVETVTGSPEMRDGQLMVRDLAVSGLFSVDQIRRILAIAKEGN